LGALWIILYQNIVVNKKTRIFTIIFEKNKVKTLANTRYAIYSACPITCTLDSE